MFQLVTYRIFACVPSNLLLVQSQQYNHCIKAWNLFKINNKLTRQWRRSCVFIATFEQTFSPFSNVCIVDFEQVNICWLSTEALIHIINHLGDLVPANIYLFKVNNRSTRKRCEICSKFTIKTPERRHRRRSGVFVVNFEHISCLFLLLLLLTLNK